MRMTEADKTARRRVIASVLAEAVERRRIELVGTDGRSGRGAAVDAAADEALAAGPRLVARPSR